MSGILGVWNLHGRPLDKAALAELQATLAHRGGDAQNLWVDGPVGLGCCLLRVTPESASEIQPVIGPSGGVAVFDGRLDNREELLACFPASPWLNADSPDPNIVLAAYERFGEQFAERLNGDFAVAILDPGRRKLMLARDAIGVRPLYYGWAADRKIFLFASEIKALLAHPEVRTQPNEDALAEFLLGTRVLVVEGTTCFRDIHSVPPSHLATITPGEFKMRRYWDFDPSARIRLGSFQEYAEAFRERFETAVRRRIRSSHPVAVAVSGGPDSSSIFCMAETLRRPATQVQAPVVGISYIFPEGGRADEQAFLNHIERDYGCVIHRVPLGPPGLMNSCEDEIWHVEMPYLDPQWSVAPGLYGAIRAVGARTFLSGTWGDQVLFDQGYLLDLFRAGKWRTVSRDLKEFRNWCTDVAPGAFEPIFLRTLARSYVPDWLAPWVRKVRAKARRSSRYFWYTPTFQRRASLPRAERFRHRDEFATDHAWSLYQTIRGYHVSSLEWANKIGAMFGLEMAYPFLDQDLISFLMTIPGDMLSWQGVPKGILREALRGVLPAAIADRRWKADFTDRVNQGVERERSEILHRLRPDAMAVRLGWVNGDVHRSALQLLSDGSPRSDCIQSWAIINVLALELWIQTFFVEKSSVTETPGIPQDAFANINLTGVTG